MLVETEGSGYNVVVMGSGRAPVPLLAALCCAVTVAGVVPEAVAAPFSVHEAAGGADSPFTSLRDDVPQLWEIYLRPAATKPVAGRRWFFPEPSLGNHDNHPFGQIVQRGSVRTGRKYWLIWDILAWVPTPHTLFLAERRPLSQVEALVLPGELPKPVHLFPSIEPPVEIQPTPIPLSGGAVILVVSLVLLLLWPARGWTRPTRRPSPIGDSTG